MDYKATYLLVSDDVGQVKLVLVYPRQTEALDHSQLALHELPSFSSSVSLQKVTPVVVHQLARRAQIQFSAFSMAA